MTLIPIYIFQGRFHQKTAYFALQICHHTTFDLLDKRPCNAFIKLKDHVADKSFTYDDIYIAIGDLSRFHASDKIDIRTLFQKRKRLFHKGIPFLFFRADIHNANRRILLTYNALHIDRSHLCKLDKMRRSGIYIRSAVDQKGNSFQRRNQRRKRRTLYPFNLADKKLSSNENRA